jgi:hypothetical protein
MSKTAEPWSLTSLREKWRQGGRPRPLRRLPDGGGRGAEADVPGNSVVYSSTAGATGTSMTGRWVKSGRGDGPERLDGGKQ